MRRLKNSVSHAWCSSRVTIKPVFKLRMLRVDSTVYPKHSHCTCPKISTSILLLFGVSKILLNVGIFIIKGTRRENECCHIFVMPHISVTLSDNLEISFFSRKSRLVCDARTNVTMMYNMQRESSCYTCMPYLVCLLRVVELSNLISCPRTSKSTLQNLLAWNLLALKCLYPPHDSGGVSWYTLRCLLVHPSVRISFPDYSSYSFQRLGRQLDHKWVQRILFRGYGTQFFYKVITCYKDFSYLTLFPRLRIIPPTVFIGSHWNLEGS